MKNEMTASEANEVAMNLEEIRDQIKDLAQQALELVRGTPEAERSRVYWYGHVMSAMDDQEYPGGSYTLADTEAYFRNDGEEA